FFAEPMYATGPELKLRVSGGLYGVKSGAGWYSYADGKRVDPAVPPPPALPQSGPRTVWIRPSDAEPDFTTALRGRLQSAGLPLDLSEHPAADALIVLTPIGWDLTTAVRDLGLDPRRAVAVDMLFGLGGTRTVMVSPATDPSYRDAAHALLAA